jgi:hypothetical protein
MRLRTIRFTGLPVAPENLKAYDEEFKTAYDAIVEKHGNDMLTVHQELLKLDEELAKKWASIESSDMPKSAKAWKKMIEKFGAPIMIANSSDNPDELVLVIVDRQLV